MAKAAELAACVARRRLLLSLDDSNDSLAVEDDGMQKPVVEEDSPTQPQPRLRPPPLTAAALLLPLSTVMPKFDCPPELEDTIPIPNTKLLKKSTATEHATSSFQSDPATTSNATEHAVSRLPSCAAASGEDCRTACVDASGFPIGLQD